MILGFFLSWSWTFGSQCLVPRRRTFFLLLGTNNTRGMLFRKAKTLDRASFPGTSSSCRGSSGLLARRLPTRAILHCRQLLNQRKGSEKVVHYHVVSLEPICALQNHSHYLVLLCLLWQTTSLNKPAAYMHRKSACHTMPRLSGRIWQVLRAHTASEKSIPQKGPTAHQRRYPWSKSLGSWSFPLVHKSRTGVSLFLLWWSGQDSLSTKWSLVDK